MRYTKNTGDQGENQCACHLKKDGIEAAIIAILVGLVLLLRFRYKPQTTEGQRWRRAGCWTLSILAILFVTGIGLVTMRRLGVFGVI